MQDVFILDANADPINIKDSIHSRINKAKAITTSVMFALDHLNGASSDRCTLYHALWAIDGYLEQLDKLFQQLVEKI
jgi:hypothetical protein